MEKVEIGETIVLENGKEYTCFSRIIEKEADYLYLISNFKPVEIKFANQIIENGEVSLQIIGNLEEKKKIYDLFKKKMNNN